MKDRTSNRINMINTVIVYCDMEAGATAGIGRFGVVLNDVKLKMTEINELGRIAEGTTKGVTMDVIDLRRVMMERSLTCGNAALAYANAIQNNTLAALVDYDETRLKRAKKEEVDDMCEAIKEAVDANIGALADYGIVGADVVKLQEAIDEYRGATQRPRQAIIMRSQAKKQIEVQVRLVLRDLLVGQLDKMVNTLKATNRNYWAGYKQSREIIDLGRGGGVGGRD